MNYQNVLKYAAFTFVLFALLNRAQSQFKGATAQAARAPALPPAAPALAPALQPAKKKKRRFGKFLKGVGKLAASRIGFDADPIYAIGDEGTVI